MEKIDQELHVKFQIYGKNALQWRRKCELLLPEIAKREIWKKKGFQDIYEYAAKLAGMSRKNVNETLRISEKIEEMPLLKEIAEEKGFNRIKPVISVINSDNEEFWAEKAKQMSKNTLETYVREFKNQGDFKNQNGFLEPQNLVPRNSADDNIQELDRQEQEVSMKLSEETLNKLKKLKGNGTWEELMKQFLEIREKQLESEKPESVDSVKSYIPADINKFIIKKTNGQCAFGNCTKKGIHKHHRNRFGLSHKHDPDDIVLLCKAHHALCHESLVDETNWTILKQPDRCEPKYIIDRKVLEYRTMELIQ